jgi:tetraacyldisaccharide 4'-kinase
MTDYLARFLQEQGEGVAVISRGYGGSAQRRGGVVSDGKVTLMDARLSGDEPQVLSSRLQGIPVLVGKDRYRAGMRAMRHFGPTAVVLDDGFQHLPLERDLNLLLLDGRRPFGNGHCLPRGVLRERSDQTKRADAFILTRWTDDDNADRWWSVLSDMAQGRPMFRCSHAPDSLFVPGHREPLNLDVIKGKRLFLFSGIARNDSFSETMSSLEGQIAGTAAFEDHHRYTDREIRLIWNEAKRLKAEYLVTTEKDYVNILGEIPPTPQLLILRVSISFGGDKELFEAYIKEWLGSPVT